MLGHSLLATMFDELITLGGLEILGHHFGHEFLEDGTERLTLLRLLTGCTAGISLMHARVRVDLAANGGSA